jgi:hypothetical protein
MALDSLELGTLSAGNVELLGHEIGKDGSCAAVEAVHNVDCNVPVLEAVEPIFLQVHGANDCLVAFEHDARTGFATDEKFDGNATGWNPCALACGLCVEVVKCARYFHGVAPFNVPLDG